MLDDNVNDQFPIEAGNSNQEKPSMATSEDSVLTASSDEQTRPEEDNINPEGQISDEKPIPEEFQKKFPSVSQKADKNTTLTSPKIHLHRLSASELQEAQTGMVHFRWILLYTF